MGYFQMKPSFVEALELEIRKDKGLYKKYGNIIPTGNEKEVRTARLKRLSELEWQLRYLQVFIEIAKRKTEKIKWGGQEEKLRYWATLYNSGFNIDSQQVKAIQKRKGFPHGVRKFNYSEVAVEFYKILSK